MSAENLEPAHAMHNHLKGIKNVPRILGVMRTGRAKVSDWQGLVKVGFFLGELESQLIVLDEPVFIPFSHAARNSW